MYAFLCHFSLWVQGPLHETNKFVFLSDWNIEEKNTLCDIPLGHSHTHTRARARARSVGLFEKIGFKRWFEGSEGVGWPDFVRECSRQHKKMTSDQASVYLQREDREWKYHKVNEAGGLACRFSAVQSSSQEQSSWGNHNREEHLYCIRELMGNQWRETKWGEMLSFVCRWSLLLNSLWLQ